MASVRRQIEPCDKISGAAITSKASVFRAALGQKLRRVGGGTETVSQDSTRAE